MLKYIWIKNKKYYLWETYSTWNEAYKIAQYYKKKNKSKYFIIKYEHGFIIPHIRYRLYMDKVMKLW